MKSKSLIFSIFLVFIVVLGLSIVSAADSDDTVLADGEPMTGLPNDASGTVSGGVDVVTVNPGPKSTSSNDTSHSGELTYEIPSNAKDIKSATVYVNVYSANAINESGLNANTSIVTSNGEQLLGSEKLWTAGGSTDGKIYTVNDHAYKCYSDYQIKYDVTNILKGLNGTSLTLKVTTFKLANGTVEGNTTYYKFDGRIKLIALVLAYDDGDDDKINYWVNAGQAWTKGNATNLTTTFNTGSLTNLSDATLQSVVLSSADANYTINGNQITPSEHDEALWMYKYNSWNVTDALSNADKLTFLLKPKTASGSIKNVLAVLTTTQKLAKAENSTVPAANETNTTAPKADASKTTTTKVATKIIAKKATFKAKKKSKKYTVTLKAGKKVLKKFKLTLKVKGKTYKATTNSKGKATFSLKKLTKKGKYTAVIKFAGNGNYKASTAKVKITIK